MEILLLQFQNYIAQFQLSCFILLHGLLDRDRPVTLTLLFHHYCHQLLLLLDLDIVVKLFNSIHGACRTLYQILLQFVKRHEENIGLSNYNLE